MAKRFADTNKYKKPFMRGLPGPYKLLWDYLYLECDHGGVWHKDFEVAQLYIGKDMPIDEKKALELFNAGQDRVRVNDENTKWLILGFAEFQYGKLNPMSKIHAGAIIAFEKFGLEPPLAFPKPERVDPTLKDKDRDMAKEKPLMAEPIFSRTEAFEQIWAKYPVKDGRKEAERLFNTTVADAKDFVRIQKALNNYLRSPKVKNGFVKNGSTWFGNWNDWVDYKGEANGAKQERGGDGAGLDALLEREARSRGLG